MAHAARLAKPNGTERIPNPTDHTTQAHTSAEQSKSVKQQPTAGYVEKATEAQQILSQQTI